MSIPKTPYLQIVIPRVAAAVPRIQKTIWTINPTPIAAAVLPSTREHKPYNLTALKTATPIKAYPLNWGRIYEQAWFTLDIKPQSIKECRYLFWKDQAEATLYVDGCPWAGFDVAHRYTQLPENFTEISVEGICCQSAIWHPDATGIDTVGSRFEGAFLARRDEAAWKAYHDYKVLFDLAINLCERDGYDAKDLVNSERYRKPLDRMAPQARRIFTELDRALDLFEAGKKKAFYQTVAQLIKNMRAKMSSMQITLTGHAHIDLVWLWPEAIGEAKAVHTFATANRLMEQYPEFHFGYSQPASYEAVARRSPKLMMEVERKITDGRWEPTGATYVESDTQLPCGEALLRSFTLGQDGFRKLTGAPSKVVWLPDVFGYTGCLPQLMQATGAEYFFTTKQAWSNSTRFPFSSFRWRGNDGTEVVAHVLHSLLSNCYNTTTAIDEIVDPARSHQQSGIHPEALIPVGYGDGGGGPSEEMCERVRRLQALDGVPPTQWGRIDQFFKRMEPIREQLPLWSGEIYLEYHRGVQTTQAKLKQRFRTLERALQTLEAAYALRNKGTIPERFWKRLVFAQFHDYIPGSSVHEVYAEALPELQSLAEEAHALTVGVFSTGEPAWFNPLPYTINHFFEQDRKSKQIQLPPLSCTPHSEACESTTQATFVSTNSINNDRLQANFNKAGEIVELVINGKAIAIKAPLNQLYSYPDYPVIFEAWEIDRQSVANPIKPLGTIGSPFLKTSPNESSITFKIRLSKRSTATVRYTLRINEPFLRIHYTIDWKDPETLLQAHFPSEYFGQSARYGAPFGSTKRPQLANDPTADAQFEVPASRWAVVSDDNERDGLAIISKDRYGFGCRDGLLHVTLVRSALITDAHRNRELRERDYPHDYSDLETHSFELILALGGAQLPRDEQPAALADIAFASPVLGKSQCKSQTGLLGINGGDSLIPAWIKPAEDGDGYLLRLHETRGFRGHARLKLAQGWKAEICSCLEHGGTASQSAEYISFKPYSLHTIRIKSPKITAS
ncbi:alpha-mannosidase [Coraliomargarita sp. W4R53]